jgi:hypothetical protein
MADSPRLSHDAEQWWLAVIRVATEKEAMWSGEDDPDPLLVVDRVEDTVAQMLDAFPPPLSAEAGDTDGD